MFFDIGVVQNNNKHKKEKTMKLKIRGLVFTGFAAAVFAQSAWALPPAAGLNEGQIDALKATVTSKYYVDSNYQDLVERKGTEGTAPNDTTTITSNSTNDQYPTSRNVYKFVKGEIAALDGVANIQGDGTYLNVSTVTVDEGLSTEHDVKQVNIITNNLASANADVTGTLATADQGKLVTASAVNSLIDSTLDSNDSNNTNHVPTSKAVYDFVTGTTGDDGFQPKISDTQASAIAGFGGTDSGDAVAVGYKPSDGNGGYGNSTWLTFGARANGQGGASGDNHLSYLRVDYVPGTGNEREKAVIDIKSTAIAGADTAIIAAGDNNALPTVTDKLTTAKAVFDFVMAQTGGATIPEMPSRCTQSGVHCALVTVYHDTAVGTSGQPGYIAAGETTLDWTVMAGAEASGGSSGGSGSGTGGASGGEG